jgi:ComEC/Rec2-related protein
LRAVWDFLVAETQRLHAELRRFPNSYFARRPLYWVLGGYVAMLLLAQQAGRFDAASSTDLRGKTGDRGTLTGVIVGAPDPKPRGVTYVVRAETFRSWDSRTIEAVEGRLWLQVSGSTLSFAAPGDRITANGHLRRPSGPRLDGSFDFADYLEDRGIYLTLYSGPRSVANLGTSGSRPWEGWGWRLRQRLLATFSSHLDPRDTAVMAGLVAGVRPRFDDTVRDVFLRSGTMHVLVASGSNVAFVVALWFFALRLLWLPVRWALATTVVPIAGYVLLVGGDPPIVRAGVMATLAIAALLSGRNETPYHPLALAALILLAFSPRSLFDVGFQMSFLTVFGLAHLFTMTLPGDNRFLPWQRWLIRLVLVSLVAQLWLWPVTTNIFRRFFPIGLLANMVVVPLSGVGLGLGLALMAADSVSAIFGWTTPLWAISAATRTYVAVLFATVRFFADLGGSGVWLVPWSTLRIASFYIACAVAPAVVRLAWCRCLFFGSVLIAIGATRATPPLDQLTWINLGQRRCLLLCRNQEAMLISPPAARSRDAERALFPFLIYHGVQLTEMVLLDDSERSQQDSRAVAELVRLRRTAVMGRSEKISEWRAGTALRFHDVIVTWNRNSSGERQIRIWNGPEAVAVSESDFSRRRFTIGGAGEKEKFRSRRSENRRHAPTTPRRPRRREAPALRAHRTRSTLASKTKTPKRRTRLPQRIR